VVESSTSVPISQCTLAASTADTHADEQSKTSNFGTQDALLVRSWNKKNRRAYVEFDIASCGIPSGAEVKTATLELYLSAAPSASRTYGAWRVTESWGETSLTWNNQPATAGSATSTASTGTTSGVTLTWNVLADVAAYGAGTATNYGWSVRDETEDSATQRASSLRSREWGTASERPQLTITYYP
jgi:hypothetical protein